jgi:hypothetical protein
VESLKEGSLDKLGVMVIFLRQNITSLQRKVLRRWKVKDRSDFELDNTRPSSIREIVIDELASTTHKGKTIPKPEKIEDLLKRVYEHIERQALEVYK